MKVCLASYQSVMMLKGGPRTQIMETARGLERLGISVSFHETWEELTGDSVDLVHLFGANIGTYHLAREINKLNIPMVVTPIFFSLHSPGFIRAALKTDRLLRKAFRGFWSDYGLLSDICGWARVVSPNTAAESDLIRSGMGIGAEKLSVVPNGVDPRFRNGDPDLFRKKYGLGEYILNVGHIGPERKNVLRLIRAVKHFPITTVIIGRIENNSYGRICQEEARRNPRLLIIDSMPNDSDLLASAYAGCSCFALPSLFETPGIAAMEAGLAGAKVAVTKHGGTAEYFGAHAVYVDPLSVDSIRNGISRCLSEGKSADLQKHLEAEFLWERVAEKTLNLYRRVLS